MCGFGLVGDPVVREGGAQKFDGGVAGEGFEVERGAAVDDQAGEPVPAGHDHQARPGALQRPHLPGADGVVEEDDEASLARQQPAERHPFRERRRHALRRHAECAQEAGDDLFRVDRPRR